MFERDLERLSAPETRNELIKCLYDGMNLAETCAAMRLNPGAFAVYRKNNVEFAQDVQDARAFRTDIMVDKLEHIQDHEENPIMAKVMSENIKWLATKRYREIYGEKLDVSHTHLINIQDAMEEAKSRTMQLVKDKPLELIEEVTDSVSVANNIIEMETEEVDPLS